jgi:azurin
MRKFSIMPLLAVGIFFLNACSNPSSKDAAIDSTATVPQEEATQTTINLNAGDDMKFDRTDFTVPVGEEITLTLNHTGKMSAEMMGHNVVVLKVGEDVKEYGNEAMKYKEEQYVPQSLKDKVIAHTELIGGGQSTTITFTIDTAGTYPFLCSFPGHYPIMKGLITAK